MPKWLLALALIGAGCGTSEIHVTEPAATAPIMELLLEVSVWNTRADPSATRAFYESVGLKVTHSEYGDGAFTIRTLDVIAGSITLRITFVPHVPPFASWDNELIILPNSHAEPDYPEFHPSWQIRVTAERFEELSVMPGARVYQFEGQEIITLKDPAGLPVRVRRQ
jgi:hypothetical protein